MPDTLTSPTSLSARPQHHLPRRPATATSVLRAIGTGPQQTHASLADTPPAPSTAAAEPVPAPAMRGLRFRDLAAGTGAATGAWVLVSQLGLIGTAGGTALISLVSAVGMAFASDSLAGARAVWGKRRERARHASRRRR
ncbi:MAG: hypothetical protein Q4G34_08615 [Micrococcus sp.]|nr:hypothetical protein [Micrococcus sp.]